MLCLRLLASTLSAPLCQHSNTDCDTHPHSGVHLDFMAALGLQVDRDGDIPVGTQLTWQIQALITEGRLLPGEQLPSVRRLADAAGVNVNTIRSVYAPSTAVAASWPRTCRDWIRARRRSGSTHTIGEGFGIRSLRWRLRSCRAGRRRGRRGGPKGRGC